MSNLISILLLLTAIGCVTTSPLSLPYEHSSQSLSLIRSRGTKTPSSKSLCPNTRIGQAGLYSENFDAGFITNITIGGYDLAVLVDTGSSDTWFVDSSYTCVNITTYKTLPQEDCALIAVYTPGTTFEEIPNENQNLTYGDGEFLNGNFGYETIELAGIEVIHQQFGLPHLAGWRGDNITSGLLGLAYPSVTREFAGTNASADNRSDPNSLHHYSPIINTMFFVENLSAPVFSLSLSRNPSLFGFGGYLTIGGIPDISDPAINASNVFAVTPIEIYNAPRFTNFTYYAITVEDIVYTSSPAPNDTQFIVDSGTTLDYFPTEHADAISALYDPPAAYESELGIYVVPCNATPPEIGITIGGETFYHYPADLIDNQEFSPGVCISGIQDGGEIFILGDTFLKNVLAVFDVGASEMAFSSRMYYTSEDDE